VAGARAFTLHVQAQPPRATLYERRTASPSAEDGNAGPRGNSAVPWCETVKFTRVGRKGQKIQTPAGADHVDLTGQTVIPGDLIERAPRARSAYTKGGRPTWQWRNYNARKIPGTSCVRYAYIRAGRGRWGERPRIFRNKGRPCVPGFVDGRRKTRRGDSTRNDGAGGLAALRLGGGPRTGP